MSTQILQQQVIHIADELKISHGDDYSEQVYLAYLELINSCPDKINTLQIIIEAFCDTIDYDNKDKVISSLQKKLKELESTIKIQTTKIDDLETIIKLQDFNIKNQESKINNLEERLTKQEQRQLFNNCFLFSRIIT